MADIKYVLDLDTSAATQNLAKFRNDIQRTTDSLLPFKTALAAIAGVVSVGAIVRLSDEVTNLRNKLVTVSPTLDDVNSQFKAIAAIAIASRAPLEAVGDLYTRIARAGGELGISQRQAAQITETLSKAMSMTGLGAKEAAGPLLQIGQALQSGRFQGDELRSVLEGMPIVSKALAEELGVTVGELRKLGSEGKITGDVFVRAMERAKEGIDAAFLRTTPTISQAFTNLRTAAAMAFDEFEKNSGTGRSTAALIELLGFQIYKLSQNIDEIMGPLTMFIKIIGALAAFTVVSRVLGAIGAAFTGIVNAVTTASSRFGTLKDIIFNWSKVVEVSGSKLVAFKVAVDFVLKPLGILLTAITSIGAAIAAWMGLDKLISDFKSLGDSNSKAQKDLQAYRAELQKYTQNLSDAKGENKATEAAQRELDAAIQKQTDSIKRAAEAYQNTANEQAKSIQNQIDDIGLTEEAIKVKNAQRQAESAYLNETKRLQDELFRIKQSDKAEDKAQIPVINGLLSDLNGKYQANKDINTKLTEELNRRLAIEKQLAEFDRMDDAVTKAQKGIELANQRYALDTAKLRLSESQKSAVDALYGLEAQRLASIEPLQQRILELKRSNSEADKQLIPILQAGIASINQLYGEQITLTGELLRLREQEIALSKLQQFADEQRIGSADKLRQIQRDTAKLTMSEMERKYYDLATAAEDSARKAIEAEEKRRGVKMPLEEQQRYYDEAKRGLSDLAKAQEEYNAKSRDFGTGWKKAYEEYADSATNAAKQAESIFKKTTQGMEDAIVNFAKTGKFEWKGFINSILEELLRSQIRQLMLQVFGIGGGGGGGGLFGSLGKMLGFANGGMIPTNDPVIVGERGPELLSGAAGRMVTPNGQFGGGTVVYNISAVDARSFKELVASDPSFIYAVTEQGRRTIPSSRR